MNILLVNDDGIFADGLAILKEVASNYGNVYVVAPLQQQSGKSQAISIRQSFTVEKRSEREYGISGTPADCVQFAMHQFSDIEFDYVFSGVNDGPNLGSDVFYSGTVGGATEAAFLGYKSAAFSCGSRNNWKHVTKELPKVIEHIISGHIPMNGSVLNINFPADQHELCKGIRYTSSGHRDYQITFIQEGDIVRKHFEQGSSLGKEKTDVHETKSGYITITPLKLVRTDCEYLKAVNSTE